MPHIIYQHRHDIIPSYIEILSIDIEMPTVIHNNAPRANGTDTSETLKPDRQIANSQYIRAESPFTPPIHMDQAIPEEIPWNF